MKKLFYLALILFPHTSFAGVSFITGSSASYSVAGLWSSSTNATWMCWAFPTANPASGRYNNLAAMDFTISMNINNAAGTIRWSIGTTLSDFNGSVTPTLNAWAHLTAVKNGTLKTLYLNGVSHATGTDADTGDTEFTIGNYSKDDTEGSMNQSEWQGNIAYCKAWEAVLTAAEIQEEMFHIRPMRTQNLVGWFPLISLADDVIDNSGNTKTLTKYFHRSATVPGTANSPPIGW